MATQPEEGGEAAAPVNPANMHFFRPSDGIYVSEGPEQRTICVSPHLPPAMARNGDWHVEQFELHKELYRGKTSLLYMATDRISGTQVALKLYRKRKLSVLNRYQVEREVRLHINLHHENIIHLFAAFEDEKHVYMVQEFAVCGDLFEDLKKGGGQMKEKHAVRDVVVPFLSALAYLHNQGIIHRDIKPENILLGANKVVKVADFGLSINIHHERPVTRAGTLDYMAPEVLVCPDKRRPEENKDKVLLGYTAQVDSWAVGILAYELLVGYPPFEQESRAATYEHIMYKEPKFPSWMSEEAKKFICLALCKNATQRPTVADLQQHSWVAPYMMRHMLPAGATSSSASPGPSRLRNSVSNHTEALGGGRHVAISNTPNSSINGMAPAHAASSTSGMTTHGSAGGIGPGVGGRMFMPVAPPPGVAAAAGSAVTAPESGPAVSPPSASGVRHQPTLSSSSTSSSPAGLAAGGAHRSAPVPPAQPVLKTVTSLQSHGSTQGPLEPIAGGVGGGEVGRLHDSISDPTARAYELHNPHPPGASAAASLFSPGTARSAGGAPQESERAVSHTLTSAGSGTLRSAQVPGGSLVAAAGAATATSGGGGVGQQAPAGGPASAPVRHRMASAAMVVPPINMGSLGSAVSGGGVGAPPGSAGGGIRLPAPPISPKPSTPDLTPGFHRPASGVLSDDSFLPSARTPSMSLARELLSPLQAQLLAPRPSSRLNSPSHSRRNSVSQAGAHPPSNHGYHHPQQQQQQHSQLSMFLHTSTPLPQLSNDYNDMGDDVMRTSTSFRGGGGALNGGGGGPAGGGTSSATKVFGKVWSRDPVPPPGGGSGAGGYFGDPSMDGPTFAGSSFSSRSGGGPVSPLIRSIGGATGPGGGGGSGPRVRMMTPQGEETRPLMRESSITSSFKSSGGGSLRDDLGQQSMTMYHRPGKVPGVGRAALAARDAEAAEAVMGAGALTSGGGANLSKAKSLVNRNLNGALLEDGAPLARLGSEVALARTAAGAVVAEVRCSAGPHGVASQRSFTSANSAFARKLANGAIATKVTEYVKGRLPHDEEMDG